MRESVQPRGLGRRGLAGGHRCRADGRRPRGASMIRAGLRVMVCDLRQPGAAETLLEQYGECAVQLPAPTQRHARVDGLPHQRVREAILVAVRNDQSGQQWDSNNETGVRFQKEVKTVEYYRDIKPIFDRSCVACHKLFRRDQFFQQAR